MPLLLHACFPLSERPSAPPPAARSGSAASPIVPVRPEAIAWSMRLMRMAARALLVDSVWFALPRRRCAARGFNPRGEDLFFHSHQLSSRRLVGALHIFGMV